MNEIFTNNSNDTKPYYFLHVPKAAGLSVLSIIRQFFAESETVLFYDELPRPSQLTKNVKFIAGGHWGQFGREVLGIPTRPIVFIREPLSRCISEYFFDVKESLAGNQQISTVHKKIFDNDCLEAIQKFPWYFSDIYTRFLGGEFPYNDESWEIKNEIFKKVVFERAKRVIDESLIGIVDEFQKSVYFFSRHFQLFPASDYNIHHNKTGTKINHDTIMQIRDTLQTINNYDLELYQYAVERFSEQTRCVDESILQSELLKSSPYVPEINGFYWIDFSKPYLAKGISFREIFSGNYGVWVVGDGCLRLWFRTHHVRLKMYVRFHEAFEVPSDVKLDNESIDFKLNIISPPPPLIQGILRAELIGRCGALQSVEVQFPSGIRRSKTDERNLSVIITQISFSAISPELTTNLDYPG